MGVGTPGEVVTCRPQVLDGDRGRPDATRDVFIDIDGQRYLRAGDLGYIDVDGYFFIIDLLKRIINISGYEVSPAEVESPLFEDPAIQEACVIAVRAESNASEQQVIDRAHTRMAAHKVPRFVEFVDSLPQTGSGKAQWRVLQERELARVGMPVGHSV